MEFISNSLEDTVKFAKIIASKLKKGNIILLFGDLGSGKTTFTKSLAKELGVKEIVTSPTFTIMNEYEGVVPIYHFDMYRIETLSEIEELGFSDIINSGEGICIIEWPECCIEILPSDCIKIKISTLETNKRKFEVEGI